MRGNIESVSSAACEAEVVIIGGGPAGLATAIALRQQGVDCLVVEPLPPPIDKGCGEGLMPGALHALRQLGVEVTSADGWQFAGISFKNLTHSAQAPFPGPVGIGVRRTVLHGLLAARAAEAGVRFAWGSHARLVDRSIVLIDGKPTTFRWLIGADGHASTVRRWAGLDKDSHRHERLGSRQHFRVAPWSDQVEVYWGTRGQIYVTPVGPDSVTVVTIGRQNGLDRTRMIDDFPDLAARLQGAPVIGQQRGAVSVSRRLHRVHDGNVALVGDASGSVDCITGEGLALAFQQALALAACIAKSDLRPYVVAHRAIAWRPARMAQLLLALNHWPALERQTLRVLARFPAIFRQLLYIHVGATRANYLTA